MVKTISLFVVQKNELVTQAGSKCDFLLLFSNRPFINTFKTFIYINRSHCKSLESQLVRVIDILYDLLAFQTLIYWHEDLNSFRAYFVSLTEFGIWDVSLQPPFLSFSGYSEWSSNTRFLSAVIFFKLTWSLVTNTAKRCITVIVPKN